MGSEEWVMGNSPLWSKTGIPQRGAPFTHRPSRDLICLAQSSAIIPRPDEISGLVQKSYSVHYVVFRI